MKKANVAGLEKLAAGMLQHRWKMYLLSNKARPEEFKGQSNPDFIYYCGACKMIEGMGGDWKRFYNGETDEDEGKASKYSHWVHLPTDDECKNLNFDTWED